MRKESKFAILAIAFLVGVVGLIPGVWDGIAYSYHRMSKRITNGDVITTDAQCYKIPDGWFIDSIRIVGKRTVYNLITRKGKEYFLLLVYQDDQIKPPVESKTIRLTQRTFNIYELEGLPPENALRYWSFFDNEHLVVMGSSVDSVNDLSLAIRAVECETRGKLGSSIDEPRKVRSTAAKSPNLRGQSPL